MSSFTRKIIKTTIILALKNGTYNDKDANTMVLQGFRQSWQISFGGGSVAPSAKGKIWGVRAETMNKLTNMNWKVDGKQNNLLMIEAGDDPDHLDIVFKGNINFGFPDYSAAPDVCLSIEGMSGFFFKINAAPPNSYKGEIDVPVMLEKFAKDMQLTFHNEGVTAKISNASLNGSTQQQFDDIVKAAGIDCYRDPTDDSITIAPKGQPRKVETAVLTPKTGLIGYPVPTLQGIALRCLYDKRIRFGGTIEIKDSAVAQCNGIWRVFGINVNIDSELPNGQWFCDIQATEIGNSGNAPSKPK